MVFTFEELLSMQLVFFYYMCTRKARIYHECKNKMERGDEDISQKIKTLQSKYSKKNYSSYSVDLLFYEYTFNIIRNILSGPKLHTSW